MRRCCPHTRSDCQVAGGTIFDLFACEPGAPFFWCGHGSRAGVSWGSSRRNPCGALSGRLRCSPGRLPRLKLPVLRSDARCIDGRTRSGHLMVNNILVENQIWGRSHDCYALLSRDYGSGMGIPISCAVPTGWISNEGSDIGSCVVWA